MTEAETATGPPRTVLARTEHVGKRYGDVVAVDDVSLEVASGEIVGLLGPNGAGKSTLVNLLVGLRAPTSGRVELFGGDPADPRQRRELGVTNQLSGPPPTLKVGEVVDFVSRHFPDPVPAGRLLDDFGIAALSARQVGGLSGGQQRRLAVALAFVGRPRLVILDEPTTGLDVEARHGLWQTLRTYHAAGTSILMSSHYLEEVERLAHRVIVLGRGRVVADDTVTAIRHMVGLKRVALTVTGDLTLPGVVREERDGDRLSVWTADSDGLVRHLVGSATDFRDLEIHPASLEDAFLVLTGEADQTKEVPA